MVKYSSRLDSTFAALSDPTRRAIVARMSGGAVAVGDLAKPFKISLPAISKHLRVLERAGLLRQSREGRIRRCHLQPQPLREADQWIAYYRRYWEQQIDALAHFLEASAFDDSSIDDAKSGKRKGKT